MHSCITSSEFIVSGITSLPQPTPSQAFVTSPAQLPIYTLPQQPLPHLATPALPPLLMATKPVTPVELSLQQQQHRQQQVALQQPQQVLLQQGQAVYVKQAPQAQQQPVLAQALRSSRVLRVPMSRLGIRSGNDIISPEFPDPALLKPPPPNAGTEFFSRVLSDTWWTNALDTCCKQVCDSS